MRKLLTTSLVRQLPDCDLTGIQIVQATDYFDLLLLQRTTDQRGVLFQVSYGCIDVIFCRLDEFLVGRIGCLETRTNTLNQLIDIGGSR